ncbi:MAG: PRC and DUF2382 domain-containing protein [Actinomycetota bacterium]|nr:PRC and DUF2382 domain-containing protein [Actinomycetota bacterium]
MANEGRSDRFAEGEYTLEGYQAYDMHYEKIGMVDDLFGDENGRPKYVGVKTGLLGTRSALIPIELAHINRQRKLVEVEADKNTIKEGPTFGDDREITSDFEQRVLNYYQIEIGQASAQRGAYGATYYPDAAGDGQVDVLPGERVAGIRERFGEDRLDSLRGGTARGSHDKLASGDELRVQRVEEELRAGTRKRETGGVRVRKKVRTDHERLAVPKKREEVHAERVPVEDREDSEVQISDDEIRVPVIEEEIVVEKRPVVKEEIRLRKEVVEDEEIVEEDVRREEVDVDDRTEGRVVLGSDTQTDETGLYLPREAWDRVSPEERREVDHKKREISYYDELSVEEVKKKLDGLSKHELKKIRSYEKEHKNRKTLIGELDRKIRDAS